ncbi:hypothetical protein N7508_003199 [Penicillium antarcticum]|uniref:uncharacterized protein n=1 Tax=Penicillium antarcticum TaxID=416450 RepID=UPI002387DA77|nr:uncharacterized protein N7508_003199 [Penicillium antarcticum]KAJ5312369.1 hypothetical protein N7508_003199 [Penicillium antarcticum]
MPFHNLPNEIILEILYHLDYQSELNAVAQTCKFLNALANKALYSQLPETTSGFMLERLVTNGNADALRRLIDHGVNINSVLREGGADNLTAVAATNGHLEIVRLLVDQGSLSTNSNDPPLLCALISENMDIAQYLVSRGAKAESCHGLNDQAGALMRTVRAGSLSAVRYLVEKLDFEVDQSTGCILLRQSIQNEKWDIAYYLLQAGANTMFNEAHQTMPLLFEAALKGFPDMGVVSFLLEKNGIPKLEDSPHWRVLARRGKREILSHILDNIDMSAAAEEYGAYRSLLVLFSAVGKEGLLRQTLDSKSYILYNYPFARRVALDEVTYKLRCPWNPLHWAVKRDHIGCVDILIEVYSRTLSPEQLKELVSRITLQAVKAGKFLMARHLLCKYPDDTVKLNHIPRAYSGSEDCSRLVLDCVIYQEASPGALKGLFGEACRYGNSSAVKNWLEILELRGIEIRLQKTADSGLQDDEVNQLFKSVACPCNFEIFNMLLEHMNVELCPSSPTHQQILLNFVRSTETEVVKLFLDKGFDVNNLCCDEQGRMLSLLVTAASDWGADEEVERMTQLLLDRGALADSIGHNGITALTHATEEMRQGVIDMLLDRGANPIFGLGDRITPLETAARDFKSDVLKKFLNVMDTRNLKFDNILSLLPSLTDDNVDWSVDTAKALTQYHWRCLYPV